MEDMFNLLVYSKVSYCAHLTLGKENSQLKVFSTFFVVRDSVGNL